MLLEVGEMTKTWHLVLRYVSMAPNKLQVLSISLAFIIKIIKENNMVLQVTTDFQYEKQKTKQIPLSFAIQCTTRNYFGLDLSG